MLTQGSEKMNDPMSMVVSTSQPILRPPVLAPSMLVHMALGSLYPTSYLQLT